MAEAYESDQEVVFKPRGTTKEEAAKQEEEKKLRAQEEQRCEIQAREDKMKQEAYAAAAAKVKKHQERKQKDNYEHTGKMARRVIRLKGSRAGIDQRRVEAVIAQISWDDHLMMAGSLLHIVDEECVREVFTRVVTDDSEERPSSMIARFN
ncbi:hypothetical protein LTR62_006014 [Meristemomyces frigidus]|uniref:Uncharacterized protein n=1 Tax=Meristemomyces frigidus TaxID=1508187 RepID=A0AAN7YTH3_9PEZI|nr:hypothetical protein LTR62_006014 [Meristemomyces frigidus]